MIEGCLKWQSLKLNAPLAVKQATEIYLESEDALGQWIEECCEKDPLCWQGSSELFASWKDWAARTGELARTQRRFVQALESRGFEVQRKAKARGSAGLRLKPIAKQSVALELLSSGGVTLVTPEIINAEKAPS
jgi:putative DNA primase/helicase